MKYLASLLFIWTLAASNTVMAEDIELDPAEDVSAPDEKVSTMIGTYVGAFGERKITIALDRVIGKTLSGYSIVAGNERAFSGSWEVSETGFKITAKEPGDHEHDGVFQINFTASPKAISGEWVANDPKIGTKKFNLQARNFKYNAKAGDYPQSTTQKLTEADVENMKAAELRIMRNEIYARHGYSFKLADMREHFDKLDWYMPMAVNIKSKLTATEVANAALIRRYEKYSAEHYDSFDR